MASAPWPEADFGGAVDELTVFDSFDALPKGLRGSAACGLLMPQGLASPIRLTRSAASGLFEPQGHHPFLDLYVPTGVLRSRRFDAELSAVVVSTFPDVGIPISSSAARAACFRVLASLDLGDVMKVLLFMIRRIEVLGVGSPQGRAWLEVAGWPDPVRDRLHALALEGRPWAHPEILRHLLLEVAAARHNSGIAKRSLHRFLPQGPADRLVGGLGSFEARVLRAAFAFQSGWADDRLEPQGLDEILTTLATARIRHAAKDRHSIPLVLTTRQYELEDRGPHIDKRARPSAFRDALLSKTGLTVPQLTTFGGLVDLALALEALGDGEQGRDLMQGVDAGVRGLAGAAMRRHLTVSSKRLGELAVRKARAEGGYSGWGSVPKTAALLFDRYPVVKHGGTNEGVGLGHLSEAWARLPEWLLELDPAWSENKVRTDLGLMFEAVMTEELLQLHGRRGARVFTERQLAPFFGSGRRPDALHSDEGRHLVLEFFGNRPSPRADRGDPTGVKQLLTDYAGKLKQVHEALARLPALLKFLGVASRVDLTVGLVVVREPLPLNPAYARVLEDKGVDPRFFCSAEEFHYLVQLGMKGLGIAGAVADWQRSGAAMSMGRWLETEGVGRMLSVDDALMEVSAKSLLRGIAA